MKPTRAFRRALARAASAAALVAAATITATSATAAIVVGTFDPPFGAIANLGFSGTVTVDIPDPCFAPSVGPFIPNAAPCSSGAMTVLSATVDFYNSTTNPGGAPIFGSASAVFPTNAVNASVTGFDIVSQQNELLGIDTAFSLFFNVTLADPGSSASITGDEVDFSGPMRLRFFAIDPQQQSGPGPFYGALLEACFDSTLEECATSNVATTTFRRRGTVPEPATALLVIAALGAVAGSARKRRALES